MGDPLLFHLAHIRMDNAIPTTLHGAIGGSDFSVYVILESILFVIGLTFSIMAMVNERAQIAYKHASLHDRLTSVWNRRALFIEAEKLWRVAIGRTALSAPCCSISTTLKALMIGMVTIRAT